MKKYKILSIVLLVSLKGLSQPTITSLSARDGDVGATITISGTNFGAAAANNVVFFGGMKATITAATSTSITVTVPRGVQYAPLTVINTQTNLSARSSVPFLTTYSGLTAYSVGSSSFANPINVT